MATTKLRSIHTTLGELEVLLLEPEGEARPRCNVVLCHGYGAPGDDLVPLAKELLELRPGLAGAVRFAFPRAPHSLAELGAPFGLAWWHLDPAILIGGRDWDSWVEQVPEGLPRARRLLWAMLEELSRRTGVGPGQTVLGGFSQGAMLTADVALRAEEAPLGLGLLSGTLLCRKDWQERAARRSGLPVFQSHGRQDPLLPFSVAERLRALLVEAGANLTFVPFDGPHTITFEVLEELATWLAARVEASAG
jgi:phospholipase/carboxylesterase